ncbi:MAG: leucine-rich repeat domain-containing protein [Microcystis panniformis Mp_MB_F_20051200_S9]|jgi:Leucine-rich repeat (LRR) protein|uniref:Leucine-rich repeat domain-containing protein n=1 Tax=Microcystis panniformis Mp_MB_F_20051200_S9 TaxID=2486223 RepID=A0A552PQJ7_9CHRO|nr:MAG: leucine-rich repeat domain-containing protein [Microcystis panniformis Mp_GB_SS_20050300_S99]TRV46229.1 MAG: leucine-rich repeat domain-containing protein [Microcystis panniformis Mp_GB_SS_20050300_S99D]TRV52486.1 MAG: leucine-rich repeat domain-containing protein [Microcystis panniformis Mp_MB_F_20080800_S26D]TRV58351.1 MAG: leucine-rich repeat domain-containing protein [Microcystis panniformis Mp_MB_F_20080800_S26]TRV59275.1 MAG: leucine-rich repeat domain-containing protein [Microcys
MKFKQSVSFVLSGLLTIASIANTTSTIAQGSNFFPSFFELCNRLQSLPPDQKYTVEILLREAKTENCQTASNYLTNLQELSLRDNQIVDITPLANLTNLQELYLVDNQIVDITPLANLTNLVKLNLRQNQIVNVNALANLTKLTNLDLQTNQIIDITSLINLTNLEILLLTDNKIKDITPLANLTNLQNLSLMDNQIVDVNPLANLNNLEILFLSGNKIKDLTPIYKLGLHVDLLGGIIINISPEGVPTIGGGSYSCECDHSSCRCDRP